MIYSMVALSDDDAVAASNRPRPDPRKLKNSQFGAVRSPPPLYCFISLLETIKKGPPKGAVVAESVLDNLGEFARSTSRRASEQVG